MKDAFDNKLNINDVVLYIAGGRYNYYLQKGYIKEINEERNKALINGHYHPCNRIYKISAGLERKNIAKELADEMGIPFDGHIAMVGDKPIDNNTIANIFKENEQC